MDFILSCIGITVKGALGGFFIIVAIILVGICTYAIGWLKGKFKEGIQSKHDLSDKEINAHTDEFF